MWQPGVLTQAVTSGYWVLLEDIDYAPMEVVSVLLPLLETRCLSVPGHGDNITAAPGFHLFATQRYEVFTVHHISRVFFFQSKSLDIFFLFLYENISCGYSLEVPH